MSSKDIQIINLKEQKQLRQKLRTNATLFEQLLWEKLRRDALGFRCRRQVGIGRYIVDFIFFEKKLIIELDGVQHEEMVEYDIERSKYFEALGFDVLRFQNREIKDNVSAVVEDIFHKLHGDFPLAPF